MRREIGANAAHRRQPPTGKPGPSGATLAISSSGPLDACNSVLVTGRPTQATLTVASFDPTSPTD